MRVESISEIIENLRNITSIDSEFELYSLAYQRQMIQILAVGLEVEVPEVHAGSFRTGLDAVRDEVSNVTSQVGDVLTELKNLRIAILDK